jgi:hypothetical protein
MRAATSLADHRDHPEADPQQKAGEIATQAGILRPAPPRRDVYTPWHQRPPDCPEVGSDTPQPQQRPSEQPPLEQRLPCEIPSLLPRAMRGEQPIFDVRPRDPAPRPVKEIRGNRIEWNWRIEPVARRFEGGEDGGM